MSFRRCCVLVLVVAGLEGCGFLAGAAVGGAGIAYAKGEASKRYPRKVGEVYGAAIEVLEELGATVTQKLRGEEVATIEGLTAGGQRVAMRIEREDPGVARVKLRVGLVGDRQYSQLILSRMDRNLGL